MNKLTQWFFLTDAAEVRDQWIYEIKWRIAALPREEEDIPILKDEENLYVEVDEEVQ